MQGKMKLYYFDFPGRAECIRILLKHAKVDFEDVRLKQEEWPALKESGKFDYKQMPGLELEDGTMLTQTTAILFYLGQKYGYVPEDPVKVYRMFNYLEGMNDLLKKFVAFTYTKYDAETKKQLEEEFFAKDVPFFFGIFEKKLKENESQDFLVGTSYTIADFNYAAMGAMFINHPEHKYDKALGDFPTFKAYLEKLLKEFF